MPIQARLLYRTFKVWCGINVHTASYLHLFKVWCGFIVHTSNLFTSNLFYGLIVLYDEFLQYTDQDQKFLDPHHTITSGLEDP